PQHESLFLTPLLFPIVDYMWHQHERISVKRVNLAGQLVDHECGFRIVRPGTADATLPHTDSDDGVYSMITIWVPVVGFDSRYSDGLVLMHELGHIVGLDHVKDPNEVMFESRVLPGAAVDDWGPGDLEGLHLLGRDAGCLTDIRDDQASGSPSP
ncbi:MAG: matrixin family metalloprotease, partial [Actinobacteria bacterium]|nr:matrixin family metalloprotease [Actinomycetota bacterium]